MHFSFWEKKSLEEKADVLILGGGITGLSTAISIKLKWPETKVAIVERSVFSLGASTKNAGFSCFGSPTEIWDDFETMGEDKALKIIEMRLAGLNILRNRLADAEMDYQPCGGYEIYDSGFWEHAGRIENLEYLNRVVYDVAGLKDSFRITSNHNFQTFDARMVWNPYEGSLNPDLMMRVLQHKARNLGVDFRLGMDIEEIDFGANLLVTKSQLFMPFEILCVCTNGFSSTFFPELKVWPARNQVLITKPLKSMPLHGCFHYNKGYFYFRNYQGRLLLGGGRNFDLTGEATDQFGNTPEIQAVLKEFLSRIYPDALDSVDYWWSGILGIGDEKEPIIEWFNDRIICGVRLGGMGVALGSWMGEKLATEVGFRLGYKE